MMSSTVAAPSPIAPSDMNGKLPALENGDHLDQKTFHARYEAMPEHVRAELIGGIVYMSSPLKPPHGRNHARFMTWLGNYETDTPGVEVYDNTTAILGPESEPQPDACLIVAPDKGGQMHYNADDYLEGAPEFVGEIASSTEAIDLHAKRADYEACGVREYVVVALRQQRIFWFVRRNDRFVELAPGPDGIVRSEVFPGLWLDPEAFLRGDYQRVQEVLRQGLASPEHAAWVAELARS